jgi:hypothetical protein
MYLQATESGQHLVVRCSPSLLHSFMETSYHLFGSNTADSAMRMVVTNVFQSYLILMYSSCELLATDVCNCDCSL